MKAEQFIKEFGEMSAKDREAVRGAVMEAGKSDSCCCSEMEMGALKEMMAKMEASKNMASMCQEMMRMCQEKMTSKSCA